MIPLIVIYASLDFRKLSERSSVIYQFIHVTPYSLQEHLRTSVPDLGQIEVDELYVALRNTGQQFIVPVQAKAEGIKLARLKYGKT